MGGVQGKLQLPMLSGGLRVAVDRRIPFMVKASCVIFVVGVYGIGEGGACLRHRMNITGGVGVINAAESNGSAKGDEKSRIDSILPLETEAPAGRKVLLWEIASGALIVIHASMDAAFGSRG